MSVFSLGSRVNGWLINSCLTQLRAPNAGHLLSPCVLNKTKKSDPRASPIHGGVIEKCNTFGKLRARLKSSRWAGFDLIYIFKALFSLREKWITIILVLLLGKFF